MIQSLALGIYLTIKIHRYREEYYYTTQILLRNIIVLYFFKKLTNKKFPFGQASGKLRLCHCWYCFPFVNSLMRI